MTTKYKLTLCMLILVSGVTSVLVMINVGHWIDMLLKVGGGV